MSKNSECQNIYKVALFVSISCVLQISESLIPHPIPGLRLGLANVITLLALVDMGFSYALEITVLRTILGAFIMGTFMSPTFILSFSAGLASTVIMGFLYWLSSFHRRYRLSIVGISILGALSHNLIQLYLAYCILIKHRGIFVFLPWLTIGAVLMGWVTGIAAGKVCLKLKEARTQGLPAEKVQKGSYGLILNHYSAQDTFIHRLPAQIKIVSVFILSLVVLIFNNPRNYLSLFLFLGIIAAISQTPPAFLFLKARKYASLGFTSFLFPVIFNSGSHILSRIGYFKITSEGLNIGGLFALRILFLILLSSLLARTTSPKELSQGIAKVCAPLRLLGISDTRIAHVLSLSWMAIPVLWEMAKNAIRERDLKRVKSLGKLIALLSDIIAQLCLETELVCVLSRDGEKEEAVF